MRAATDQLLERWQRAWPEALAAWSKFTRLRDARLCTSRVSAAEEGLSGSFAMIRLLDQSVVVDLESVASLGLQDYAVEILAHEVGHHVLAPATATDQYRLLTRIRKALPTLERFAPMVANLYTDLLINDRLQRQAGLRMADIYRLLDQASSRQHTKRDAVWLLYLRIYEYLWQLEKGTLGAASADRDIDADAWLGARLIRVYAGDWMSSAGKFATLLLKYLVEDINNLQTMEYLHDTKDAAEGCEPYGMQEIESDEQKGAIHPSEDPAITGLEDDEEKAAPRAGRSQQGTGQAREPFEYGEILKAAGLKMSDHDIAVRYYRERALPYLVRFPTRQMPESKELQLEGLEPWDLGDPLDTVDWLQSLMIAPRPIPGVTTVKRVYGLESGREPERQPIDLDMYVDSSGSMPNPQQQTSYLALAGAVIALSALRVGARVQVTLWSGKDQFQHTGGFVRDEDDILRVLTGFYGGATCFPIHHLRGTYAQRNQRARAVHILMISDDGITTMFDNDERGNSGWQVAEHALAVARAGGTMALNIPVNWMGIGSAYSAGGEPWNKTLQRAEREQGWRVHAIQRQEDLLQFAREFSRRNYDPTQLKGVAA
jgi:hypothetical protein